MAGKRKFKGPKTLFDKVKEIDPYFAEEAYASTDEKLNERLSTIAKEVTAIEDAKDADLDLKKLQEQAKVAGETYTLPQKALKLKRKLVYKILQERGKVP